MSDDGFSTDGDDGALYPDTTVAGRTYPTTVTYHVEPDRHPVSKCSMGYCGQYAVVHDFPMPYPPPPADPVNHPPHYTSHPSGVECITITRHMGFNLGNAVKYLWRADLKGSDIQDLEKAAWYIQDELDQRRRHAFPGAGPRDGV